MTFVAHFVSDAGGVCHPPPPPPPPPAVPAQIVGYFPEWGVYHQPWYDVKSIVESGAADGLTIINYAFVVPAPAANGTVVCKLDDPVAAYQQLYSSDRSVRWHLRHARESSARPLQSAATAQVVSIQTSRSWRPWVAGLDRPGSPMRRRRLRLARRSSRRAWSCSSMVTCLLGNGAGGPGAAEGIFDGFDLDWEYPVAGGVQGTHHRSGDGDNFTLLLQEFRRQFAARGRDDGGDDDSAPDDGRSGQPLPRAELPHERGPSVPRPRCTS